MASTESERRAAPRRRCLGACVVRLPGAGELSGLSLNLSRLGVAVLLPVPLPEGTRLVVKKFRWDTARPLHATVVRCCPQGAAYLHGCVLSVPLAEDELTAWLT
jgi:hypothetical protein